MTTPPTVPLPAVPAFPRPSLFAPPAPRRRTRKVLAAVGAVIVLVGGVAVHAAAGPSGPTGFRTAVVRTSDVAQTLEGVGAVEPVTQAAVAFPVAGKVASVGVAVGDGVNVGQTLATLDGASLQMAIDAQQAAVAQAQLVLANARNGVSSGTGSSGTSPSAAASSAGGATSSGRGSGGSTGGGSGSSGTSADPELARAQQDVLGGQQAVDEHLQSAQQALVSAGQICAAAGSPTSTTPTAPTTSTTAIGDTPDQSSAGGAAPAPTSSAPDAAAIVACQTALQGVLDAQRQTNDAQATLGSAAATYDQLLDQRAADLASASSQSSAAASSSRSGNGASGGGAVTSADLIKDQSAVDAALAQLAVAQQALHQATIVSPISGTVASVGLAVGDAVTAGSSTGTIVVVGTGGMEVTMTVSVDHLPGVALGENATIRPDGSSTTLTGKVVAIGAPATASNGTTTYPVSIGLPDGTTGLRDGSVASVSIVTKAASHALVVPTAAVHTAGTTHTVNVVSGSTTRSVRVGVGAIGATWTEITSGVQAGQKVVLADLQAPLPTSATQVSTSRTGNTGPNGVRIPGGFGGAGTGNGNGRRAATAGG